MGMNEAIVMRRTNRWFYSGRSDVGLQKLYTL
jgi:hypothetical protein